VAAGRVADDIRSILHVLQAPRPDPAGDASGTDAYGTDALARLLAAPPVAVVYAMEQAGLIGLLDNRVGKASRFGPTAEGRRFRRELRARFGAPAGSAPPQGDPPVPDKTAGDRARGGEAGQMAEAKPVSPSDAGAARIARQREIVAQLAQAGHPTDLAIDILEQFIRLDELMGATQRLMDDFGKKGRRGKRPRPDAPTPDDPA
jgi:hypothetical protein